MFHRSNPEIERLRSKVLALKSTQANSIASANREVFKQIEKTADEKYGLIQDSCLEQEQEQLLLEKSRKKLDALHDAEVNKSLVTKKNNRELIQKAEKIMEDFEDIQHTNVEESTILRDQRMKKAASLSEDLQKQISHQAAHKQYEKCLVEVKNREEEIIQQIDTLKQQISEEEQELHRSKHNHQIAVHVFALEKKSRKKEELKHLQKELELALMEKDQQREKEKLHLEERNRKAQFSKDIKEQIRLKELRKQEEIERENEYKKIIAKLQEMEAHQIKILNESMEIKKQRNKFVCDYLLIQRRKRRQKMMDRLQREQDMDQEILNLRQQIYEEEEKKCLLEISPELLPFLTKDILAKLASL